MYLSVSHLSEQAVGTGVRCRHHAGKLSCMYNVGYCAESHYRWASDRLIIPVRQVGFDCGWQARKDVLRGRPPPYRPALRTDGR